MINNINNILAKYWEGQSSLEEEAQLRSYFLSNEVAEEHKEYVPLFQFYASESQHVSKSYTGSSLLAEVTVGIDRLVDKYLAGETDLGEEEKLKAYFASEKVKPEHLDLVPLFGFFKEQEGQIMTKELNMDFLESSSEDKVPNLEQPKVEQPKVEQPKVRRMFPKVAAIAASFAVLAMFTFGYFQGSNSNTQVLAEAEKEEALAMTMEALAYLGHNYDKGANPMKHFKQLEKTNIFKFN